MLFDLYFDVFVRVYHAFAGDDTMVVLLTFRCESAFSLLFGSDLCNYAVRFMHPLCPHSVCFYHIDSSSSFLTTVAPGCSDER